MKKFLFFVAFCLISTLGFSQAQKSIENSSNCDIEATLYYAEPGSCAIVGSITYVVGANNFVLAVAPSGYEFVYAEVSFAGCSRTGQFLTVGCGPCNPGYPSTASAGFKCDVKCVDLYAFYECGIHLIVQ
jgi:hypothetical protein